MEDGLTVNEGEENLGSLIRASIDIDGWISNEKAQYEGDESGLIDDQEPNIPSGIVEETSYSRFQKWNSEYCEKQFCELEKYGRSECFPSGEMGNYDFGEANCTQEPQQGRPNSVEQIPEGEEQLSQEDIGSSIILEKTSEQIRFEDIMKSQKQARGSEAVQNSAKVNASVKNFSNANLQSFQDAFLHTENPCQVTTARETANCYKCHGFIEPRDWIRAITTGTGLAAVYHANCFYCDYCKGVLCTDQYYTFHQGKLICNFDFQMLTNLRKVTDHNKKRLVVLHNVKKEKKKIVQITLEQKEIIEQALNSKNRTSTNVKKNSIHFPTSL